jgi:inosose dehydratase
MKSILSIPTRRQFLAGALAATQAAGKSGYSPTLAAQVYVWTQHLRSQNRTLKDGLEEIFAGTRQAGYERVELMSIFFQPDVREQTLALLKKHRLQVPIVYNGGPMHEAAAAEKTIAETLAVADIVRGAGARVIDVNPNPKPKKARKSDEELEVQSRALTRLAGELKKRKMQLIVHHHDPEMAENAREWRYMLRHTDVPFCMDVHWIYRGGQDPLGILREAGKRVASLHLRNSQDGVWTESLGDGDVDYRKVAAHLRQIQYSGFLVVELAYEKGTKITRSLPEDLRLSRIYSEQVFDVK